MLFIHQHKTEAIDSLLTQHVSCTVDFMSNADFKVYQSNPVGNGHVLLPHNIIIFMKQYSGMSDNFAYS